MAKTTTISVRVPEDTRDWLERRTHKMGTAGSAAARILEESRRRESFRAVEFRDFAVAGEDHAGVLFVSIKSLAQNDFRHLAHAIVALVKRSSGEDNWTNRVDFLTRE